MSPPQNFAAGFLLVASIALAGCDSGNPSAWAPGEPGVERRDSAGVEVVMNRGPDRPLDWQAEEVLRLGGPDAEGPEAFHRITTANLGTDAEGNMFLVDGSDLTIHVFGLDGRHVRTFAGRGEGPGELRFAYRLMVEPDGSVRIIDSLARRIVRFDAEGNYLGGIELPSPACCGMAAMTDGGMAGIWYDDRMYSGDIESRMALMRGDAPQIHQLVVVPMEGESFGERRTLAELAMPERQPTEYPECPSPRAGGAAISGVAGGVVRAATIGPPSRPPIFSRELISWTAGSDRVGFSAGAEYAIQVVDASGRPQASVRRERPPIRVTHELAAAEIGPLSVPIAGYEEPCEVSAEEAATAAGWSEEITWITGLSLTPGGRWFVQRRDPGADPSERIDVFEPDGEYLGTLPPDFPWPAAWRSDDEFVRVETDDLDVQYLVVERIVE